MNNLQSDYVLNIIFVDVTDEIVGNYFHFSGYFTDNQWYFTEVGQ